MISGRSCHLGPVGMFDSAVWVLLRDERLGRDRKRSSPGMVLSIKNPCIVHTRLCLLAPCILFSYASFFFNLVISTPLVLSSGLTYFNASAIHHLMHVP